MISSFSVYNVNNEKSAYSVDVIENIRIGISTLSGFIIHMGSDEATSSLDPENAKAIYSLLLSLKDIMLIAITHEWSDELTNVYNRRRCYSCC